MRELIFSFSRKSVRWLEFWVGSRSRTANSEKYNLGLWENRYSGMVDMVLWLDFILFIPKLPPVLSSHSQLILPHTNGSTTRLDDELIVWHWPLNRMKRRGPGNVISQYNYIPNGLSSTKDVKWWCAFSQRPFIMIWRTSEALCYHLPTRQTLSGHFPDRGTNISFALTSSYIHIVILTLDAATEAGSAALHKSGNTGSFSKSELEIIR